MPATITLFNRLSREARTLAAEAAYEATLLAVAEWRGVPLDALRRPLNQGEASRLARGDVALLGRARARQETVYLTATIYGLPIRAVARVAGLDPGGVSRVCRDVEEWRSNGRYDRELDELELELMA